LTRLPTPLLVLHDSEIKKLAKLPSRIADFDTRYDSNVTHIFTNAGNRMSTARRCHFARLFLTLQCNEEHLGACVGTNPSVIQILTRVSLHYYINTSLARLISPTKTPDFLPDSRLTSHFITAVIDNPLFLINKSIEVSLILPEDFIEELKHAGLLT